MSELWVGAPEEAAEAKESLMGYKRLHAIVVSSWDPHAVSRAQRYAAGLGLLVSNLVDSRTNGYVSFLVAPDGSKEGWARSEEMDQARDKFVNWMNAMRAEHCYDYVEVQFGDDYEETAVISSSDDYGKEHPED